MKQKLLLVSAAMMLMASSALADGWVNPKDTPVEPSIDGTSQYLIYNPGAKGFIVAGNNWGTRACVAKEDSIPEGYYFRFTSVGDTAVMMEDSCLVKSNAWMKMFNDGAVDNTYMDTNNTSDKTSWIFNKQGETLTYTIQNLGFMKTNPDMASYCFGCSSVVTFSETGGSGADTRTGAASLYMFPADSAAFTTWYFVDGDKMKAYIAAPKLKEAIDEALEQYPDLDLAAEKAIYDAGTGTFAAVNGAIASVKAKVAARDKEVAEASATAEKPVSLTGQIVNSTFDVIGDFHGWSGSGWGAGGTKSTCAERYGSESIFDTWQEIKDLPNGVYALSASGFYRVGSHDNSYSVFKSGDPVQKNLKLYAVNITAEGNDTSTVAMPNIFYGIQPNNPLINTKDEVSVVDGDNTYYVPNTMETAVTYFNAGYFNDNTVMFVVTEGTIKIGAYKRSTYAGNDWCIFDNFGLNYYGKGADAYTMLVNKLKAQAQLPENALVSKSVAEDYAAALAAIAATNYEEYLAAKDAIAAAYAVVEENAALWAELADMITKSHVFTDDDNYNGIAEDLAWAVQQAEGALEEKELTNDELKEKIQEMQELYNDVSNRTPADTDVTHKIVNRDFANGFNGWTTEYKNAGNVAANASAKCAEAWKTESFDIYQIVRDLPVGMYEVQCQGFYRHLRDDNAWNAYFNADGTPQQNKPDVPAYIYMNDSKTKMANVFEYQSPRLDSLYKGTGFYTDKLENVNDPEGKTGLYSYPNDMASAGKAFDKGAYVNSAWGLVAKEGDSIRIGMKGTSAPNGQDCWAIFTRFKLIYRGYPVSVIAEQLKDAVATIDPAKISENVEFEGQYIDKDLMASAQTLSQNANALLTAGEDGNAMFQALSEIWAIQSKIEASLAIFKEIHEVQAQAVDAYTSYSEDGTARESVLYDIATLVTTVGDALGEGTMTDAEAQEAIDNLKKLIKSLSVPATIETATDEQFIPLAELITNAGFEDGLNGWTNDGAISTQAQSNDAFGKLGTNYCERWHVSGTIDMNQTIEGYDLPAGTYSISALAHCSTGDGVIYANDQEVAISNLDAPAAPNRDMVYFVIERNQPIKFGVKCTLTSATWCCVDDFQLTYYGANSEHQPGPAAIDVLNSNAETTVDIVNLNGVKMLTLKQGINIVRKTDAQGNVKVVKVLVK
ncbi:MAG: hypothetical protein IJS20_06890 [Bacteroidales bacterium]|nr:hypothetical protein [Bacteroidales bacterium]